MLYLAVDAFLWSDGIRFGQPFTWTGPIAVVNVVMVACAVSFLVLDYLLSQRAAMEHKMSFIISRLMGFWLFCLLVKFLLITYPGVGNLLPIPEPAQVWIERFTVITGFLLLFCVIFFLRYFKSSTLLCEKVLFLIGVMSVVALNLLIGFWPWPLPGTFLGVYYSDSTLGHLGNQWEVVPLACFAYILMTSILFSVLRSASQNFQQKLHVRKESN